MQLQCQRPEAVHRAIVWGGTMDKHKVDDMLRDSEQ